MQKTALGGGKPRRARSLIATLGVTAALAGIVIPVALPASASAMPMSEWCQVLHIGWEGAVIREESTAVLFWGEQLEASHCYG